MNKLTSYGVTEILNKVLFKVVAHHSFSNSYTRQILHQCIAQTLSEEPTLVSFMGKLAYQLSALTSITHSQWCDYLFNELVEEKLPELEYDYLPHRLSPHVASKVLEAAVLRPLDQNRMVAAYHSLANELPDCHIMNAGLLIHFAKANSAHANLSIGCLLWRLRNDDPLVVSSPLLDQSRKHIMIGLTLCSDDYDAWAFKDRYSSLIREAKLKYSSTSIVLSSVSDLDKQHLDYVVKTARKNSRQQNLALQLLRQVEPMLSPKKE